MFKIGFILVLISSLGGAMDSDGLNPCKLKALADATPPTETELAQLYLKYPHPIYEIAKARNDRELHYTTPLRFLNFLLTRGIVTGNADAQLLLSNFYLENILFRARQDYLNSPSESTSLKEISINEARAIIVLFPLYFREGSSASDRLRLAATLVKNQNTRLAHEIVRLELLKTQTEADAVDLVLQYRGMSGMEVNSFIDRTALPYLNVRFGTDMAYFVRHHPQHAVTKYLQLITR